MKLSKYLILLLAILGWTAFIIYGAFFNKFLQRPFNAEDSCASFIEASKNQVASEFVGNLAMVLIENGEIEEEYFHTIDEPVDGKTVFQIASISKWVTSWGILKLVEEGKLDLDKSIDSYLSRWNLPESGFDNSKVNARRLLSHTSGLADDLGYGGFGPNEEVQTLEESLTSASDGYYPDAKTILGHEPGSKYMYSGGAYTLLQLVIEEVSGQPFQEYMTNTVLKPLGMTHSTFDLASKPDLQQAQLFDTDGSIAEPIRFTALAAASLYTCTDDLSKFMLANIQENPVLKAETIELMSNPEAYINKTPVYGMGPHLYSQGDTHSRIIGHDGSGSSVNTAARVDLMSKDGIIILEMGSHNIASNLADEWIFWKAGIADYVVIMRNKNYLLTLLILGYLTIISLFIVILARSRKKKK